MRSFSRNPLELRPISLTPNVSMHAEGSVQVEFGNTKVLVTCSVEDKVPPHLLGKGQGWVTAEYGMLPRSTNTRSAREAARGKQGGRTLEIQRLIGRSLRAARPADLHARLRRVAGGWWYSNGVDHRRLRGPGAGAEEADQPRGPGAGAIDAGGRGLRRRGARRGVRGPRLR